MVEHVALLVTNTPMDRDLAEHRAGRLAGGDDSPRGDGGDGFLLSLVQLAARAPSGDTV
jgi:hypothetical protein